MLTEAQIQERDAIKAAQETLQEAAKVLQPLHVILDDLLKKHTHVWGPRRPNERDCFVICQVCGEHRDVWWCPKSDDHVCHYGRGSYGCTHCGESDERK
jgi:hypothetical protein